MRVLIDVILLALDLYWWVIVVSAIMSWLLAFNVLNARSDAVRAIWEGLQGLTEPVLRPIRRVLPQVSGLDLSPIVLILGLYLVRGLIVEYVRPYVF